jgi:DUF1680 family protein
MSELIHHKAVILDTCHSPYARLKSVSINSICLDEGFWHSRVQINQTVTLHTQYQLLESTGRLDNFRRVSGDINKPFQGYVFNDSDIYKWLEAASWLMIDPHDEQLKQLVDQVITMVSNAQDKDGYLNTYFSLERSGERWTNLQEKHELYCAGHLIQAAIAHYRVTGEDKLLSVAIRLADHIYLTFGPTGREGTSGHPEIEMALIELYRTTGEEKYFELATIFIDRRGHNLLGGGEYLIDHLPLRKLEYLTGHAVRALYLCSGAADLVLETGEQPLMTTLEHLWTNMVNQQMYITGGVGARYDGEAFGRPYELPNARAYAETCAAIASIMWNWRMLQMQGNPRYADLLEWTFYNAVLPGISLDGKEYFYVNPLKDDGVYRRQKWFDCACCPPNISRTIAMFPGYLYSVSKEGIWLHLYAQSRARIELSSGRHVELKQSTSYPWDGHVSIQITSSSFENSTVGLSENADEFSIFLRLPGWLGNRQVEVKVNNGAYMHHAGAGSYLEIHRNWRIGDNVSMDLPMDVRFFESHPNVEENFGRIAITRGPLLYCLEEVDNPNVLLSEIWFNTSKQPEVEFVPNLLGGVMRLRVMGKVRAIDKDWDNKLYRPIPLDKDQTKDGAIEVISIPYFAWANRKLGAMAVWHLFS